MIPTISRQPPCRWFLPTDYALALDWAEIVDGIKTHGIRNGACLTIAPTGTISTVAGCEGYGCEPVFALAYTRYVNDSGKQISLQYTSPQFDRALRQAGLSDDTITRIVEQVNLSGTCQDVDDVPEHIRRVFVVSGDVKKSTSDA
jgi:ribonucleoside-diphosphate reductase alpha chain